VRRCVPGAVQVRWTQYNVSVPAWDGLTSVGAPCPALDVIDVTVTVSNSTGSASRDGSVECPEPPCPRICPINQAADGLDSVAVRREGTD